MVFPEAKKKPPILLGDVAQFNLKKLERSLPDVRGLISAYAQLHFNF